MRVSAALPLASLLLAAACGDTPTGEVLRSAIGLGGSEPAARAAPPSRLPPTAADSATPAEPSLSVTVGARRVLATLVQQTGEQRMWRSEDGLVVATDGARVVATAGLRTILAGTRLDGPDPLDDALALEERGGASLRRSVDLMGASRTPEAMRFGVRLDCRLRTARAGGSLLVEERCGGGASFVNRYWAVPETGAVWRSEQWVGEDGRPMVLEVVTPPAS